MAQSLDAGDQLNAKCIRIIVHEYELLASVASSQVSKKGLALHLVGVLGVELHHVDAHKCTVAHHAEHARLLQHTSATAVNHDTKNVDSEEIGSVSGALVSCVLSS